MQVPVLMYHRIAPKNRRSTVQGHYVHPRLFARQMEYLHRKGYQTVGLDSITTGQLPNKPIAITFDDGYMNFHEHALPALERLGFVSTVFLVADLIGKTNEWDEREGDVSEPLLTWDQIRDAAARGTQFGSHTSSHADLAAVDSERAWTEISQSKRTIEQGLGAPVPSFCYPYGRKSDEVVAMVGRAGYQVACSTEKGVNGPDTNPLLLRRINVRSDTTLPVLILKFRRNKLA